MTGGPRRPAAVVVALLLVLGWAGPQGLQAAPDAREKGLPGTRPVDVRLPGKPLWLHAALDGAVSYWIVSLEDGRALAYRLEGGTLEPAKVSPGRLPPGMPPGLPRPLVTADGMVRLVVPPRDASPAARPVTLPATGRLAYVAGDGDLVVVAGAQAVRLPVDALPDARLVVDEFERILLLSMPTKRYAHGVLGDAIEAGGITLVQTSPEPRVVRTIRVPGPAVIEGLSAIWYDLDGDGRREIIVTVSDEHVGARLVAFDEQGNRVAEGPPVGRGYRWRHQLAAADFAPGGELEIAAVRTPHIGGVVEFFRLEGDSLRLTATRTGYSTHRIGSRNLEMWLAGDLDGDGRLELLVPDQSFRYLAAIRRTRDGTEEAWRLDAGGPIGTNPAAAILPDGGLAVGVGREDGVLRLWVAKATCPGEPGPPRDRQPESPWLASGVEGKRDELPTD